MHVTHHIHLHAQKIVLKNGESIPDSREDELSWDDFIMAIRLKMKSCVKGAIKGVAVSVRGDFFLFLGKFLRFSFSEK